MTTAIVDPDTANEPAPITEEQVKAAEVEEANAFEQEFADPAETTPTTTPATTTETQPPASGDGEAEKAVTDSPATDKTDAPPAPEYVQITKSDWEKTQALLNDLPTQVKRGIDDVNGRFGGLQQLVQSRIAATPKGQKVEFSADDFKELREEFPQLADMLLKGLNRSGERMTGTAPTEPTQPTSPAPPVIDVPALTIRIRQDLAREELAEEHADWKDVVGLPDAEGKIPNTEFRRWLGTKPQAEQDRVLGTWNPRLIAKTLTDFKEHQQKQAQAAAGGDGGNTRRARVQSGVVPRSAGGGAGGPSTPTEEQSFMDGFKGK